jgi:UDP-N-acetylglucosamine 2-epimerase (non-hydrolysing)
MRFAIVVGARPNFMKAIPVYKEFIKTTHDIFLVHTGQHYSKNLSDIFFEEFRINNIHFLNKEKDYSKMSSVEIFSDIMINFNNFINEKKIDKVIVFGDINSTLACALTASMNKKVLIHIESGLRSYDMNMPEEKNRILVDKISDMLFVTEINAIYNLKREGITKKIFHCGNTMIDSLVEYTKNMKQEKKNYIVLTIHREENTTIEKLKKIFNVLVRIEKEIIFVCHPRTRKLLEHIDTGNTKIVDPMPYIKFIELVYNSYLVITDSGGLQEETSYLNIPCITIRRNTERPLTTISGTNTLISPDNEYFDKFLLSSINLRKKSSSKLYREMGNGHSAKKIVKTILLSS